MANKTKKSLALHVEEKGPIVLAILTFIALIYFSSLITYKFNFGGWKSAGLYAAIFDWSAIQTGFAFGVYGFVIGKANGFAAKMSNTLAMQRFKGYIRKANIMGIVLTIVSIPLIVVEPKLHAPKTFEYFLVSLWFSLFVWSFLSFLRMAYNFGQLASVKNK